MPDGSTPSGAPYEQSPKQLANKLGPYWSASKVISELGLPTHEALEQAAAAGQVLLLPLSDGPSVAPVFQFARTRYGVTVRPQVLEVLRILSRIDPWTLGLLLTAEAPELGGQRPIDIDPTDNPGILTRFARQVVTELR